MEVEKRYWPNGKLRYEFLYRNGKLHGIHKAWYENGKLKYEYPYQNGERHGICKRWHENGQLLYKEYWLYGNQVSQEEYRRHQLITQLAGIKE